MDELTTLGFDDSDGFDIALRRRGRREDPEAIFELIVNGMFAMDTTDASSEVALADIVPNDASCVLVGGLAWVSPRAPCSTGSPTAGSRSWNSPVPSSPGREPAWSTL